MRHIQYACVWVLHLLPPSLPVAVELVPELSDLRLGMTRHPSLSRKIKLGRAVASAPRSWLGGAPFLLVVVPRRYDKVVSRLLVGL